ncbi:MAG: dihydroorotase [Clostridia bacterium]|nr:dihydroorotase [Clostridia bacterium]
MRVYKNAAVYREGKLRVEDVAVDDGKFKAVGEDASRIPISPRDKVIDCEGKLLTPGLADVHVHLRQPGFSYKETIETGTLAAARGGFTVICAMPNLNPVPDCYHNLEAELDIIRESARVRVLPYGTLTKGRKGSGVPAEYGEMARYVAGFTDDGTGVQDRELMRLCMRGIKPTGRLAVAHCEDDSLLCGGYVHAGRFALANGHAGICSQSEWKQLARDVELAKEVGCPYHACHLSTAESIAIIRKAKSEGMDVSCETAPHYLALCDEDISDDGRFKMNPPIRSRRDMEAIIQGVADRTIDMIATDHAPHSAKEKSGGLRGSAMGVVGLETAFAVMYTRLVLRGFITLERLLELMCDAPRKRFGLPGGIAPGEVWEMSLFDLDAPYIIDPSRFASMGRATPFEGMEVKGRAIETVVAGKVVYTGDL